MSTGNESFHRGLAVFNTIVYQSVVVVVSIHLKAFDYNMYEQNDYIS